MATLVSTVRQFLSEVPPFQGLPPSDLDRMSSFASERHYAKGETIYGEGDPADSVWIVERGRIGIFKYNSLGRPLAVEMLRPHELFGTLCRLGARGRPYPCTAIPEVDSEVIRIPERIFMELYQRSPSLVMGLCTLCSQRLRAVQDFACLEQEHVQKRIANILLSLVKNEGAVICMTKREIGALAGTSVETAIRIMSAFSKKGWLKSLRGKTIVLKREPFEQMLLPD